MRAPSIPRATPRLLCSALLIALGSATRSGTLDAQAEPGTEERIRVSVELMRAGEQVTANGRSILAVSALPEFYEARAFAPAWISSGGDERLAGLLRAIRRSEVHGLDPEAYHLQALESWVDRPRGSMPSEEARVDAELLATDAFLVLGSHLLHGRVNPETIDPEWLANRRDAQMDTILAKAVADARIEDALFDLAPRQARYRRMLDAARELRAVIAIGGWPIVPEGPTIRLGSEGPRVQALRARLLPSGDGGIHGFGSDPAEPFDPVLAEAVHRFQLRHGLEADSAVGRLTLTALNVPATERLRQVEINLERWRWLPADLGARHIEVNIPSFETTVVEDGRIVAVHRSVVGRPFRATPVFSETMTYLVLAPYWHVPPTIAAVDKLPLIRANPAFIAEERMTLLDIATNRPVDPASVDWADMTGADFNRTYRLRQDPGPYNALGGVKFMFPNRHNIYLHDTPTRSLFDLTTRDFSSGCIRVDRPFELAEYLLRDRPEWTRARIDQVARDGVEQTVPLSEPIQVHLLYWTAWVDEDGTSQFREDIYGRDDVVWRALTAAPPVEQ